MKNLSLKILFYTLLATCMFTACKKDDAKMSDGTSADDVTAIDYQYNTATKKFTPQDTLTAQIASPAGVRLVYSYLLRTGKADSLIHVFFASEETKSNVAFGIPKSIFSKINMATVNGIKLMIKHIDNTSYEDSIKIASFVPPLPKLEGFAPSLLPDNMGVVNITGKATSANGIKRIDILDDSQGSFTVAQSITDLNNATEYNMNYDYIYRPNAGNLKVIVVDNFDLTAEVTIKMPILPYNVYQDVMMGAQGSATVTVTNNTFFAETGTTAGSCQLNANEATMDFLFYGTSNGPTFYSPSSTANVAANYRCNGTSWTINNSAVLKATRFRVLVPGTSPAIDAVYTKFNANTITELNDDGLFTDIPAPGSSTVRYTAPPTAPTTSIFNTTTAYLIWVKIPKVDGTFRNCLIKAKEVVAASTTGLSTIKFDILVQK